MHIFELRELKKIQCFMEDIVFECEEIVYVCMQCYVLAKPLGILGKEKTTNLNCTFVKIDGF